MALNFSPNVEKQIIDKSLISLPAGEGGVGFVFGAEWGPINKIVTVNSERDLIQNYGSPVYLKNSVDWYQISEYLNYNAGAKVVRVASDTRTTVNASKVVNYDNSVVIDYQTNIQKINVVSGGAFVVGDDITTDGTGLGEGKVLAISTNELTVLVTSGYFLASDGVDNANPYFADATTIDAGSSAIVNYSNSLEQARRLNIDDSEPSVSFLSFQKLTLADGSTFAVNNIISTAANAKLGVIRYKNANDVYVQLITGTFAGADSVDNDFWSAGVTTVSSVSANHNQILSIYARYPGDEGNDIKVAICDKTDFDADETYDGTSTFNSLTDLELASGELFIVVTDSDNEVLETHVVSTSTTATYSGGYSKFIDDYLYNNSIYIYSKSATTGTKTIADYDGHFELTSLTNGAVAQPDYSTMTTGYDVIFNDTVQGISFVCDSTDYSNYDATQHATLAGYLQTKATATKDHFCIVTLPTSTINDQSFSMTNVNTFISGLNEKYVGVWDNWKKIFDRYNKKYYFVPCSGDVSGVLVNTKEQFGSWEAPFGTEKGLIKNTSELYHTLAQGPASPVSQLYKAGVNSILYKDGYGFLVWGQKTMYTATSDFSRINTTLLVIEISKRAGLILDRFISKTINEATFAQIRNAIDKNMLKSDYADRGAFNNVDGDNGYLFVCDFSNNTSATINRSELYCDLYIKPAKSAEYIKFRVIATPGGTSFNEITV